MGKIDISQSMRSLDFGPKYNGRIQRACRDFDIATIRDLCQCSGKDLMKIRGIGKRCIEEIESVLEGYGLHLGMLTQEMDEYAGATLPEGEDGTDAGLWEQRRYEVAREMFVRHRIPAEVAVCEADELMNALKLRNTMHP